jgi:hypothetical protein
MCIKSAAGEAGLGEAWGPRDDLRRLERMSELGIPLVEIVPTKIYK